MCVYIYIYIYIYIYFHAIKNITIETAKKKQQQKNPTKHLIMTVYAS